MALIVLALVVTPAIVFAVTQSSGSHDPIGSLSPGTEYINVAKVPGGDISARVANYQHRHPADACYIQGNGAICATANNDQVVLIVAMGTP